MRAASETDRNFLIIARTDSCRFFGNRGRSYYDTALEFVADMNISNCFKMNLWL
jgi:hypothetical protein